jgi:predicted O-methyltransferase YrrM
LRYGQLHQAVALKQPKAILEVGTWNGGRALTMLKLCPTARYYGFDLFEEATAETDAAEMNVKAHHTLEAVQETLKGYDATLYKGNTRDTLAAFNEPVDFVWLDGGHSIETIRSDWENVKRVLAPGAWVFFDDYYTGPIDTETMGCNKIVAGLSHQVYPAADKVTGGGFVQMVRVFP